MEAQFQALGKGADSRGLAVHLLSATQGVSVLAHTFHDPGMIEMEAARLKEWIRELRPLPRTRGTDSVSSEPMKRSIAPLVNAVPRATRAGRQCGLPSDYLARPNPNDPEAPYNAWPNSPAPHRARQPI